MTQKIIFCYDKKNFLFYFILITLIKYKKGLKRILGEFLIITNLVVWKINKKSTKEQTRKNKKKKTKKKKKKGKKKKKILKFKKGDVINIKTFTTIINPKKKKRNLKKEKSNKNNIISDNSHKKESSSNNNDFKLSSLDLSLDDMDQQETYLKNFYKTYQIKKNKLNEEDNKNDSRLDDFSNKDLNVK